ncbi:uncharacterized protein EV154DRAFT_462673 [Mucor mucedo]|uniref:uncharacterized protein n=1 Tax=Mucor mucedo TaxID=29922 RepID=UPI00221E6E98|nr:uncharacterized protein EV154DRAFT_462673 [Mucor mucedo]KAI7892381.1 hypothetical protein EV154DRAFT_462673 [Mucor mucedo]
MSVSKNCSVSRKRAISSSTTLFDTVLTTTNSIDYSACFEDTEQLPERKKTTKDKVQFISNTATHHHQQIVTDTTTTATTIPRRVSSQRSVPAFLHKLFSMVNDGSNTHLIRWAKDGNSFLVQGHEEFAQSILPRFYKHNTFASFVRQLNMYDFHKVPHLHQGVLIAADNTENEVWEFSHPQFKRDRPDLLTSVTRKRNRDRENAPDTKHVDLGSVVQEITAIKNHQINITTDLRNLHKDNEMIWKETLAARENHQKHQKIISKILQFLTVVFSNDQHQLNLDNEQDPLFCPANNKADTNSKDGKMRSLDDITTIDVPTVKTNRHAKIDTNLQQKNQSELNVDLDKCKTSTCRSAQAITNDINILQDNVETLAAQLGINSGDIGLYSSSHSSMISSATQNDRLRLFKLADDDNNIAVSPPQMPSAHFTRSNDTDVTFQQNTHQEHKSTNTKTTGSSSTSTEDSNPLSFFLCQFLKSVDSYHTDPPFSCVRGTASTHVNDAKNAICQSDFIPCDTSSSDLTLGAPSISNELFFKEVQRKRTVIRPTFHNTNSDSERYKTSSPSQHPHHFTMSTDNAYNTIIDTNLNQQADYIRSEYQARPSHPFYHIMPNHQQLYHPQPVNSNNNNNTCSQQVSDNNTRPQQKMDSAMFMN